MNGTTLAAAYLLLIGAQPAPPLVGWDHLTPVTQPTPIECVHPHPVNHLTIRWRGDHHHRHHHHAHH